MAGPLPPVPPSASAPSLPTPLPTVLSQPRRKIACGIGRVPPLSKMEGGRMELRPTIPANVEKSVKSERWPQQDSIAEFKAPLETTDFHNICLHSFSFLVSNII